MVFVQQKYEEAINNMKDRFSDIERYTDDLSDKIRAYYLEPNIDTFEDIIRSAYSFEEAAGTVYLDISSIINRTLGLLSSGLAIALLSHARENRETVYPWHRRSSHRWRYLVLSRNWYVGDEAV